MTLAQVTELTALERDIAQLERAIQNPSLAASVAESGPQKMALERIAQKRMRIEKLKSSPPPQRRAPKITGKKKKR